MQISKDSIKHFAIELPIFKFKFNLFIGESVLDVVNSDLLDELYEDELENNYGEKYFEDAQAITSYFADEDYYVMILTNSSLPGIIAHEAFHLLRMLAEQKDIPLNDDTEEVYAYLLDYIVEIIHDCLNGKH